MEANSVILCDNLIKWLQTLNLNAKHATPSELSDGVAIAEALTQIAPEYFTSNWNSKIKTDVGHNWRLKVSNLKKILEGVVDYHQDILSLSLDEFSRPDVVNIAEHADRTDLGRLLQLVLSCAVNCIKKEEYITRIMDLELSCQRSIMQAIQELETITLGPNRNSIHSDTPAVEQTDADMREALAQRCHELDTQVKILQEEKMTLLSEVSRLTAARAEGGEENKDMDEGGASLGPAHAGTLRYSNMRAQLDALKDELYKVELQRDDQRVRADNLERELAMTKLKNEELQMAASENVALKDEVDALRETAAKAAALEAAVASYKKRMEEHVDLRRQVKLLERANTEHVQRAIEHEQAAARALALRSQLDIYKKQVTDLNEKLDAEITKADKLEIENKKLSSRGASLQRERDALLAERDTLRETVDELRCSTITVGASEDNVSRELIPHDLKERMIRLEHENKLLRQNQGAQADQASVQTLLEDYASRLEKQRALNREANARIMQLEAALEPAPSRPAVDDARKSLQIEDLQSALADKQAQVNKLQEALSAREAELLATEDKYKKCVEKAKEVIKSLDPRTTGQQSLSDITLGYTRGAGVASATSASASRAEGATNNNRHETSPSPSRSGSEESGRCVNEQRLLASAWYQLGARCHREAVESRFALLSAGHSFLARQRRQPPRPRPAPAQ
ncbi:hook protein [Danaus plexippus plexippus]|uniref:Protein hook n=1 Tax=Danaus plexippus plexippus TaxID=278856 RepID=A0A212FLZ6_DANPL|nr:protein hook [Danaus plexippus plexippus]OWR54762.1 hook protein [Danaus plexippus plexippus]